MLAAGCDEAGFVGQYNGLDTVAEAEFGQYPPDMDLDGSFGQVQFGGDLAVGSPGGELGEHGLFPVGELTEHGVPVVLPVRIGEQGSELVNEPPGGGGSEHCLARGDGADGAGQFVGGCVFEQEAAGTGLEAREDVLIQVVGGQDEDLAASAGGDRGGRLDSVHAGHPDIHQHHVRVQR